MNRHNPSMRVLFLLALCLPCFGFAADPSGAYANRSSQLAVMAGPEKAVIIYTSVFGQAGHLCGCSFEARPTEDGGWNFSSEDGKGMVRFAAKEVVIDSIGDDFACCGANWPHPDEFPAASRKAPKPCRVRAPKAFFHSYEEDPVPGKAYVVKDDVVDFIPLSANGAFSNDYGLGRYNGLKTTLGILKRADLTCR